MKRVFSILAVAAVVFASAPAAYAAETASPDPSGSTTASSPTADVTVTDQSPAPASDSDSTAPTAPDSASTDTAPPEASAPDEPAVDSDTPAEATSPDDAVTDETTSTDVPPVPQVTTKTAPIASMKVVFVNCNVIKVSYANFPAGSNPITVKAAIADQMYDYRQDVTGANGTVSFDITEVRYDLTKLPGHDPNNPSGYVPISGTVTTSVAAVNEVKFSDNTSCFDWGPPSVAFVNCNTVGIDPPQYIFTWLSGTIGGESFTDRLGVPDPTQAHMDLVDVSDLTTRSGPIPYELTATWSMSRAVSEKVEGTMVCHATATLIGEQDCSGVSTWTINLLRRTGEERDYSYVVINRADGSKSDPVAFSGDQTTVPGVPHGSEVQVMDPNGEVVYIVSAGSATNTANCPGPTPNTPSNPTPNVPITKISNPEPSGTLPFTGSPLIVFLTVLGISAIVIGGHGSYVGRARKSARV